MEDAPFDLSVVDSLLRTTRSVRKRLDLTRPVPRSVLLECFALAQQAPTASNQERLRFLVVEDPELKHRIADIYRAASSGYLASGRRPSGVGTAHRVMSSAAYLADNLERVPALVLPLGYGIPHHASVASGSAVYGSLYPGVWSFMLAARARGLGTTLTTFTLSSSPRIEQMLGIESGWQHFAVIPTAYTVGTDFRPTERPDVSEIVEFV